MASQDPNAQGFSSRKGRKPPTLELKAEEVRVEEQPNPDAAPDKAEPGPMADKATPAQTDSTATSAPSAESGDTTSARDAARAEGAQAPAESTGNKADAPAKDTGADTASPTTPEEPPRNDKPHDEPPRGSSRLGAGGFIAALIAGALAGGAAGGGVVYYMAAEGRFTQPAVDLTPLTQRLSALEERPAITPQALASVEAQIKTAQTRLAALSGTVGTLEARPEGEAQPALPEDAAQLLTQLRQQDEDLKSTFTQIGVEIGRLSAAQTKLGAQLETQATQSEQALQQAKTAADTAGETARQVAALAPRLASITQDVAKATQLAQQSETLAPRIDVLDSSLTEMRKAAEALAPRIAALGSRIADERRQTDAQIAETDSFSRSAAAMVVMADLQNAVRAGRPFTPELNAARTLLGPQASVLDPLSASAEKGFTPRATLAEKLEKEGANAFAALKPVPQTPEDGSLVSRFLSSAGSLVTIRPAGGPDMAGAQGALARAVVMVRVGELDNALFELRQLPPQVSEKLTAITAEIEARRQAVQLASSLYRNALAAISGKTQ
ncbi:hypothetical protein ACT6QH_11620 [Xanthobacter sp. TB0139]|uniref:hypothetical protein n=1 Tax=Xanthobacter sp. TB0139 TaxID=3459178 RepID=UPI0040397E6F